jgi:hypothetical protein
LQHTLADLCWNSYKIHTNWRNRIETNLITQADSGGKVNTVEEHCISHCEKIKSGYEQVSNSNGYQDQSFFLGGHRGTRTPQHFVNLKEEIKILKCWNSR